MTGIYSSPLMKAVIGSSVAACSFIAAASAAKAADMPELTGLYSQNGPAPTLTWAGSYAGIQIGGGQMAGRVSATTRTSFDKAGLAGGIYAGHNWEVSRFILGVEADLTYMGGKKRFTHATIGGVKAKNSWSASLKGRVGLPVGRFMPYLSTGLTAADYALTASGVKKDSINVSLNFGAGVDYAISRQLRLRADYSLHGLNGATHSFGGTRVKNESAAHTLMIGLSYAF